MTAGQGGAMTARKQISFTVSAEESRIIHDIAKRAAEVAEAAGVGYDLLTADMDITATHANGCPLKLRELLAADAFNFSHDIFGIRRHLNRRTGALENCFLPRYADIGAMTTAAQS